MDLHQLKAVDGARKDGFRKGRGIGSGNGKTAGKGHKGQNARSGGGVRPGFEGGQNPIYRRLPKRGFHNYASTIYDVVNIEALERFEDGTEVNPTVLVEVGLVRNDYKLIKVLGNGKLTKKLTVFANKFSKTAESAIVAAGGRIEVI
ncbi:MAG TPA: 50S ribosomal protein L15 [Firmicutes bacterium]|jgi:large subunit ribosomal protein L15|nr:50S ribosomal protein L15 [Bacillota bacterium]